MLVFENGDNTCVMNIPGDIAAKEAGAYSLESRWLVGRSTDIVNSNFSGRRCSPGHQGVMGCRQKMEVVGAVPLCSG